jgi:hypoxanthine phosphoribosyltransferase/N-acetylglutamate synthase-like GNAT family acetyltransferase
MQTLHLSEQQVDAYLNDLATRLKTDSVRPDVLIGVGLSGSNILLQLVKFLSDFPEMKILFTNFDRAQEKITYFESIEKTDLIDPTEHIAGKNVLLVDDAVHTGNTLIKSIRDIEKFKPSAVASYALVVRRGAKVIPNKFGFLVGDHDRVLFLNDVFPNNRLTPTGIWRKLFEDDMSKPMITTGEKFIDQVEWASYWYENQVDLNRHTYVYELNGKICGFVSFRLDNKRIVVDNVATDKEIAKQGIGGFLMRWVEHFARHLNCQEMYLWAIEGRIPWYQKMGYEQRNEKTLTLGQETFVEMAKKLQYILPEEQVIAMER